jgi:hypothetical protein
MACDHVVGSRRGRVVIGQDPLEGICLCSARVEETG